MNQSPPLAHANTIDVSQTPVAWSAIVAGAIVSAALTLILLAFGSALGLATVSPWSDTGVSATTFKVGTGIYLLVVAVMASAVGGYLASRLRMRWNGLHTNEVYFRDTAHGLTAWALATVFSAAVLGGATSHIVGGVSQAAGGAAAQAAARSNPTDIIVDKLFRADPGTAAPATAAASDTGRAEIGRLLSAGLSAGGDVTAADRSYVARVVAARTGLSQADAEKRVADVITDAKLAIDKARKAAIQLSLWLAAALLLGAFAASLAAVEGGQLRDGTWTDRTLSPRTI